jgi:hypothetical protein
MRRKLHQRWDLWRIAEEERVGHLVLHLTFEVAAEAVGRKHDEMRHDCLLDEKEMAELSPLRLGEATQMTFSRVSGETGEGGDVGEEEGKICLEREGVV